MSFGLPSVKPKPDNSLGGPNFSKDTPFELPSMMMSGYAAVSQNFAEHPLIQSERDHYKNKEKLNHVILRNTQGLHAPLRLNMELKSASKVGHLPFLHKHNVMLDSLTGRDLEIGPEDIFNTGEFSEVMGQPHAMVERHYGLL